MGWDTHLWNSYAQEFGEDRCARRGTRNLENNDHPTCFKVYGKDEGPPFLKKEVHTAGVLLQRSQAGLGEGEKPRGGRSLIWSKEDPYKVGLSVFALGGLVFSPVQSSQRESTVQSVLIIFICTRLCTFPEGSFSATLSYFLYRQFEGVQIPQSRR